MMYLSQICELYDLERHRLHIDHTDSRIQLDENDVFKLVDPFILDYVVFLTACVRLSELLI